MRLQCWSPLIAVALAVFGCSGPRDGSPVEPGSPDQAPASGSLALPTQTQANRYLWGLWEVQVSADHQSAEVIPLRTADMHLNAVRMLEITPCSDCLEITEIHQSSTNEILVGVTLTHPFQHNLNLTGFDVRGIFISTADYTFPVSGRRISRGGNAPRMLRPDGYTALFNPAEFPETQPGPPAFRYIPGRYSLEGDLTTTLNPFVGYGVSMERRMFTPLIAGRRYCHLRVPEGPFAFGYAVDACWKKADGQVTDPAEDFPPDANCHEAYLVKVTVGTEPQDRQGSMAIVQVEVFDHQGQNTISAVTVEAPDLFTGVVDLDFIEATGPESSLYEGMVRNDLGAGYGEYPLLVRVVDTETDPNLGAVDCWQVAIVSLKDGWARSWGGEREDYVNGLALGPSDQVYLTGGFRGVADFDPGPGSDIPAWLGGSDAFLSAYDANGHHRWVRAWGGGDSDSARGVAVDGSGNICVVGTIHGTVDLDPGLGVDEQGGPSTRFAYLSKMDSQGNYIWGRSWGQATASALTIDTLGNIYVTGDFTGLVDFDPGPGTDDHDSVVCHDVFLTKFTPDGEFLWVRTWGAERTWDTGADVTHDSANCAYVVGEFHGTVDFDPGAGADEHSSEHDQHRDIFLSKLDSNGDFQWAATWAHWAERSTVRVAADSTDGVYVAGRFRGSTDFDPGPDEEIRESELDEMFVPTQDSFLSKLDTAGDFIWVRTWGGPYSDIASDVTIDRLGNPTVAACLGHAKLGSTGGSPSSMTEPQLLKFNPEGEQMFSHTWGWGGLAVCYAAATGSSGEHYLGGYFAGSVDLDPGPGLDEHFPNGSYDAFVMKLSPDGTW